MSYDDLLGGDPDRLERSAEDIELGEYIQEYGVEIGLAVYREDNGLDLSDYDVSLLERLAAGETGDSGDSTERDYNSSGDIERDYNDSGGIEASYPDDDGADLADDTGSDSEWTPDPYPDAGELGGWDVYERDYGLDLSPDAGDFEPYEYHYTIYLNDGSVREGDIMIYHEDTDIEDAIWAANDDLSYDDGVIG